MSTPFREESSYNLYCRSRNLNESSDSHFVSPYENGNNNSWQTCSHKIIKSNESAPIKTFLKIAKSHCTGHLLFANQQPSASYWQPQPSIPRVASVPLFTRCQVSGPLRHPSAYEQPCHPVTACNAYRHHARASGGRCWLFLAVFGQIGRWISQYLQLLREIAQRWSWAVLGLVAQACNPSTWTKETGRSGVQGRPQLPKSLS